MFGSPAAGGRRAEYSLGVDAAVLKSPGPNGFSDLGCYVPLNGPEIRSILFLEGGDPQRGDETFLCLCHGGKTNETHREFQWPSQASIFHSSTAMLLFDSKAGVGELAVQRQG